MHVLNDRICINSVKNCARYIVSMTGGMSSKTCYTKLNVDFRYVRSLSLRRDTYVDEGKYVGVRVKIYVGMRVNMWG